MLRASDAGSVAVRLRWYVLALVGLTLVPLALVATFVVSRAHWDEAQGLGTGSPRTGPGPRGGRGPRDEHLDRRETRAGLEPGSPLLPKPFSPESLARKVSEVFATRGASPSPFARARNQRRRPAPIPGGPEAQTATCRTRAQDWKSSASSASHHVCLAIAPRNSHWGDHLPRPGTVSQFDGAS